MRYPSSHGSVRLHHIWGWWWDFERLGGNEIIAFDYSWVNSNHSHRVHFRGPNNRIIVYGWRNWRRAIDKSQPVGKLSQQAARPEGKKRYLLWCTTFGDISRGNHVTAKCNCNAAAAAAATRNSILVMAAHQLLYCSVDSTKTLLRLLCFARWTFWWRPSLCFNLY